MNHLTPEDRDTRGGRVKRNACLALKHGPELLWVDCQYNHSERPETWAEECIRKIGKPIKHD